MPASITSTRPASWFISATKRSEAGPSSRVDHAMTGGHRQSLAITSYRRTSSDSSSKRVPRAQSRASTSHSDQDDQDDNDDFDQEAEKELLQYLDEQAESKKKRRKVVKRQTEDEMAEGRRKLCEMLDPKREVMDDAWAEETAERSILALRKPGKNGKTKKSTSGLASTGKYNAAAQDSDDDSELSDDIEFSGFGSERGVRQEDGMSMQTQQSPSCEAARQSVNDQTTAPIKAEDSDSEVEMVRPSQVSSQQGRNHIKQETGDGSDMSEPEMELLPSSIAPGLSQAAIGVKHEPRSIKGEHQSDTEDSDVELLRAPVRHTKRYCLTRVDKESSDIKPILSKANQSFRNLHKRRPAFDTTTPEQEQIGPLVLDDETQIQVPASINAFLRDYQRDGIHFLYKAYKEGRGGILADDMGLGKTIQVIGFLAAIMGKRGDIQDQDRRLNAFRSGRMDAKGVADALWPTCLILVPQSVTGNWLSELDTWGYFEHGVYGSESARTGVLRKFESGQLDVLVVSHEFAKLHIEDLRELHFSVIFADEAHKFKNPATQITRAMHKFDCKRRFAMTGTLIQNRSEEMWTLLDWTNPGAFQDEKTWLHLVAVPMKMGQRKGASAGEVATARLVARHLTQELLPRYMLRRTKALIADQMPTKSERIVFCPLAQEQNAAYRALCDLPEVKKLREWGSACPCGRLDDQGRRYKAKNCCSQGEWAPAFFMQTLYLLTCLSNHCALFFPDLKDRLSPKEEVRLRHEKQVDYTKRLWPEHHARLHNDMANGLRADLCGKWLVLRDLLTQWHQQGDKVLLFSRNLRLLSWLDYWLAGAGYKTLRLDGSTHKAVRQDLVNKFNREADIFCFLISTAAGGTGLNLTGANKVVVFDPNWSPALDAQAIDRAYRIGQSRDVSVFRLIGVGTMEELIYGRQVYKSQVASTSYTATKERRYFEGVEGGGDELTGELFGVGNLLSYQEGNLLTKAVIEDYDPAQQNRNELNEFAQELKGAGYQDEEFERLLLSAAQEEQAEMASSTSPRANAPWTSLANGRAAEGSSRAQEDDIIGRRGITYTHDHQGLFAEGPNKASGSRRARRGTPTSSEGAGNRAVSRSPRKERKKEREQSAAVWPPPRRRANGAESSGA